MNCPTRKLLLVCATGPLLLYGCDRPEAILDPASASPSFAAAGGRAFPLESTSPCSGSGGLRFRGAVTDETNARGTGRLAMHAVVTPQNCTWSNDGGVFEIDGSPSFTVHGSREVVEHVLSDEITGTVRGRVAWTSTGQSTLCHFEVKVRAVLTPPRSVTLEGTECGKLLLEEALLIE